MSNSQRIWYIPMTCEVSINFVSSLSFLPLPFSFPVFFPLLFLTIFYGIFYCYENTKKSVLCFFFLVFSSEKPRFIHAHYHAEVPLSTFHITSTPFRRKYAFQTPSSEFWAPPSLSFWYMLISDHFFFLLLLMRKWFGEAGGMRGPRAGGENRWGKERVRITNMSKQPIFFPVKFEHFAI